MIGALIAVSGSGADDFGTVVIFGGRGGGLGDAGEATRGLIGDMLETLGLEGLSVLIFLFAIFACDEPVVGTGGESKTFLLVVTYGAVGSRPLGIRSCCVLGIRRGWVLGSRSERTDGCTNIGTLGFEPICSSTLRSTDTEVEWRLPMIVWPATDSAQQMMNKTKVVMKVCEMFFEDSGSIFVT